MRAVDYLPDVMKSNAKRNLKLTSRKENEKPIIINKSLSEVLEPDSNNAFVKLRRGESK
jgi:hypothetical protein